MSDPDKMISLGQIATRDGSIIRVHRDYEDFMLGDLRLTPDMVAALEDRIAEWKQQVNDYILRADEAAILDDDLDDGEPAMISEAAVDKAMATQLGLCPAVTGPDEELDRALYCDKQLGEDNRHAGNHHAHVGDGSEVAWGDADDPWIRRGTRWPALTEEGEG